ncbi:MAG: phenylalanine--tRNA ligase subunit beta [Deltaproteobacteria bacterium]|nr:phenylalanine--tRNA ligase subunit beta [Deltaproteobacteria bacterium]
MRVPYEWLGEFVDNLPEPEILAEKLTLVGLEVESIEKISPEFRGVTVGRIAQVSEHPKRPDLKIVKVDTGEKLVQVVCGAKNVFLNSKVAFAGLGARLPGNIIIEKREILGVFSEGMLCSEKELGLSEDESGIFILPDEVEVGFLLENLSWTKDFILDVNCAPNRGDLLSILGIAREVASITKSKIRLPDFKMEDKGEDIKDYISLNVLDLDACPRYVLRMIEDVKITQAPYWMRWRISKCGMRPINSVVDITNYVMLELGQPLHAFDYELLRERKIEVRVSTDNFTFRTLDGQERAIHPGDLLICDGLGPVAIAGIMGGENSEIRDTTKIVALESAFFNPFFIRRTARRMGIRSEASLRFEKGIDMDGVDYASKRAIYLMEKLSGGRVIGGKLETKKERDKKTIYVNIGRLNEVLGTNFEKKVIKDTLESIYINAKKEDEAGFLFEIPSFRHDLNEYMDIVEEVARIKGYETIPETLPVIELKRLKSTKREVIEKITREYLFGAGFYEIINFSFFGEKDISAFLIGRSDKRGKPIRIMNPISKEFSFMRTFLSPGILRTVGYNTKRGEKNLRVFEFGHIFFDEENTLPLQKKSLAFAMTGKERDLFWRERFTEYDFFDIKGVLEGLMQTLGLKFSLTETKETFLVNTDSADISVGGTRIGWIGELREEVLKAYEIEQRLFIAELDFDAIVDLADVDRKVRPISKYPYAFRDFSFYVSEEIAVGHLTDKIKAISDLITSVVVFDVFRKERRSVTFRVFFQSYEGTLRDEEIDLLQEIIIRELTQIKGVDLRT